MDLWLFPIIKDRSCATLFVPQRSLVADGQKQRTVVSAERQQMMLLW